MARTALDDLIDIYREAQLALIKIIIGKTGAGTKTYYNSILKQTEALLNRLSAQTGRYINTEIPKAYKKALEETYAYFQKNGLQMNRPEMFAQIHSDAVSELAAEMQHHINEGISQAGRRVMRYADTARDNALRQNGLRASAVKIASGQTVRDMQKYLTQALSEDGFLTVQYGSGKYAYQVGLDSYAGLVARSTTREAGNLAREKQLTANGYDLVIITKHSPTCELCARVQGRVFSISGKDKRFPPLSEAFPSGYRNVHPNCRCVAVPWIEELQSPEELRAAIAKGSQPLKDERSAKEKALYTKEQAERRQLRADRLQFERYKARLGDDAPQTFSSFHRIKNEDGDRWESLQKEYRQRFESVHNSSIDNSGGSGIIKSEDLKMSAPLQKPPDFSKYEVKSDLKAVEAFKETVSAKLGIPISDISLDGIRNTEVLEPFINRIEQIQKETGMKMPALRSLSVIDGDETCIAGYKRYENAIYISSKYFNSKDALVDTLKEWANNGTLPKQGKTIRYLAEHETAHIRIPVSDIESEEGFEIFRKAMKRGLCENDKNIYEFYADCEALDRMGYSDKNIQDAVEYLKRRRKK